MKKLLYVILTLVVIIGVALMLLQKDAIPIEKLRSKYANEYSGFINLEGMNVHYRIEGEGQPLVLIHGTGALLQTWDPWTDSLKKYYKVIRMDIPAFGLTGPNPTGDYSSEYYVHFIDTLTKAIGVDSFILGGNSLGGEIAWKYALAHPHRVTHLLLLAPGGSPVQEYDMPFFSVFRLARITWLSDRLTGMDTKILVGNTLKQAYEIDSLITPQKIEMYYDISMREGNREAFVQRLLQIADDPILDPSKVITPTLILWGDKDAVLPIRQLEGFRSMPNAAIIVYEGVGHTPQDEVAAKSVTDALKFLRAK
jgi:pimeloyl-ACP methyl ester carboxylesterase